MRKLLFATYAAMALSVCGNAVAENNRFPPPPNTAAPDLNTGGATAATVVPLVATTAQQLVFSKDGEQASPIQSPEDSAVAEQLRDLIENKLSQQVPRQQDRAGVEAFYRNRGFAPLWVAGAKPQSRVQPVTDFLHGVTADGLDPAD